MINGMSSTVTQGIGIENPASKTFLPLIDLEDIRRLELLESVQI